MQTREWRFLDKTPWGPGPWDEEPDKIQWEDPQTGLPCLVVRAPLTGSLCGYVGVSPAHPFFGIGYGRCLVGCPTRLETSTRLLAGAARAIRLPSARVFEVNTCDHPTPQDLLVVHGGLTYSAPCQDDEHGICHLPDAGEPQAIFWFGFDTGHCNDVSPTLHAALRACGAPALEALVAWQTYRDLAYVQAECRRLALQLDDRDWEARLAEWRRGAPEGAP